MHEYSICRKLIELASEHAEKHAAAGVKQVVVSIGELALIDPRALAFAFHTLIPNSILAAAELKIDIISGHGRCRSCDKMQALAHRLHACIECGSYDIAVTQGTEIDLKQITMLDAKNN